MLKQYREKRNLTLSREPAAEVRDTGRRRFVVQEHDASRLHYDFRLEVKGILRSWAVPKGPPLKTGVRRLAVLVEDHPVGYIDFEGVIPEGHYGAGTVRIWDRGTYEPEETGRDNLKFVLHGGKLRGPYTLVRMQNRGKNWLLIKLKESE